MPAIPTTEAAEAKLWPRIDRINADFFELYPLLICVTRGKRFSAFMD